MRFRDGPGAGVLRGRYADEVISRVCWAGRSVGCWSWFESWLFALMIVLVMMMMMFFGSGVQIYMSVCRSCI